MKSKIKQRIEQIKSGQVPDGYKKTKIGVVPKEWEEVRFKKMFSRLNRKNYENNDNVLTISAQYGLISQSEFFNKNIASEDKSNYFLLHKGEYAYNKSYSNGYPYGALKKLERYEKGIVSPLYICFSPTGDNKCAEYYSHYFESNLIGKEIKAIAQEGARNHGLLNISVNDFFNMYILNPPLAEQEKIVKILSTQDRIIELYQRKIEELQNMKKIYLSKMFPKKDENVPEWRFPQFTDAWEQRKFSDIVATRRGLTYKPSDIRKNGVRVLRSSNIAEDSFTLSDDDVFVVRKAVNIDYARANDILITAANGSSRLVGKHTIISGIPEEFAVHGGFMLLGTTKEPHFVNASMGSSWYRRFIELFVAGGNGAIGNLNKNDLDNQEIAIPSEEEQKIIGTFFQHLDNLIALHQRKLEGTKKYKKALMQLLLTGIVRCE